MDREESVDFAQKFIEDIVSFFGENITVNAKVEEDIISLDIESSDLNIILIGRNAETMRSLQHILSSALYNKNATINRVVLDVADYKKQREEKLAEKARGWIEEVRQSGNSHIARINAADRRVVHRVASEYSDIRTYSEGEGRERYIVIAQASS